MNRKQWEKMQIERLRKELLNPQKETLYERVCSGIRESSIPKSVLNEVAMDTAVFYATYIRDQSLPWECVVDFVRLCCPELKISAVKAALAKEDKKRSAASKKSSASSRAKVKS